ncbi:MAG: HEAT repeat domain-containing protein [Nitrospirae bacterium]|nr:HEAT repeat domain-containing protein [Nitrospirota bacterium]
MSVRMDTIKTLAGIKDSRAVEPLIELLSDKDHNIRSGAINALSGFIDKRPVPFLLKIMSDKNEPADIRLLIMSALRQIDPAQWTKNIVLLVEDPSPEIRREAIRGISTLQDPSIITLLLKCLMDKDKEVGREVVLALGNYKDNKVVDQLITILKSSTEEKDIRIAAINSLARIRDER